MLYLKSKLLHDASVPHGFSLRQGGVSLPPYDSLNLGFSAGDDPNAVETNLRRLHEAAGLRFDIKTAKQVHGDRIVDDELREILPSTVAQEDGADALISERAPVGVRAADCAPILLFGGGKAAAAHSGWKGTRLRIAARTATAMRVDPRDIIAAIGPCIGRCCYEVSVELAAEFRALFGNEAVEGERHLDLRFCIETALRDAGVVRIEQVPGCTSCDSGSFFSHRRDKGRTGRHLAFIAPMNS